MSQPRKIIAHPEHIGVYARYEEWHRKDGIDLAIKHAPEQVVKAIKKREKNPERALIPERYKELITEIDFAHRGWFAFKNPLFSYSSATSVLSGLKRVNQNERRHTADS